MMAIHPHREYTIEIEGLSLVYSPTAGTYEIVEGDARIDLTASYADQGPLLRALADGISEMAEHAEASLAVENGAGA